MATTYSQAEDVLIASYIPGIKFASRITAGSIDSMPISGLVIQLHCCLWETKYHDEYKQFIKIIEAPKSERQQSVALGWPAGSGNKVKGLKKHIKDTLIADGIKHMPGWLWDKCEVIWEDNLKLGGDVW